MIYSLTFKLKFIGKNKCLLRRSKLQQLYESCCIVNFSQLLLVCFRFRIVTLVLALIYSINLTNNL